MIWTSEKLKALRKARGESQEIFAVAVGVAITTISRWECGKNLPDGKLMLERLQNLYDFQQNGKGG